MLEKYVSFSVAIKAIFVQCRVSFINIWLWHRTPESQQIIEHVPCHSVSEPAHSVQFSNSIGKLFRSLLIIKIILRNPHPLRNPLTVNDFRPISILNLVPKLISKILANRLCHKLPDLISTQQTAFIKGRQIAENFIATRELLHHLDKDRKSVV